MEETKKKYLWAIADGAFNYCSLSVFIMAIMTYFEDFVRYNPYLSLGLLAAWLIVTNVLWVAFIHAYE